MTSLREAGVVMLAARYGAYVAYVLFPLTPRGPPSLHKQIVAASKRWTPHNQN